MTLLAKIRPGFDGDSDTFGFTLFGEMNSLVVICRDVSTQGIMQISNKVITIRFIEGHECSAHDDELHFINIVSDFF